MLYVGKGTPPKKAIGWKPKKEQAVQTGWTREPPTDLPSRGAGAPTTSTSKASPAAPTAGAPTTPGITTPGPYDEYMKRVQEAAAQTRETGKVDTSILEGAGAGLEGTYGSIAEAAIENYRQQAIAQGGQAEKAASALEMVGTSTVEGLRNLEGIQAGMKAQVKSASDAWSTSAEKADEYVQAARDRVGQVLAKLDEANAEFAKERSFAKAHAMQASVQATLGSMRAEERNILETYGAGSAEYQQFQAGKRTALGTVQSNIHAAFQQLEEEQNKTYLTTVSDAFTKSNMYLGFQEQQHVEMLRYSQEAKAAYELQAAQFDVSIEQLKMAGLENLANWIIETPSFTMDMTPLFTLLGDLAATQESTRQTQELLRQQAEAGEKEAAIRKYEVTAQNLPEGWFLT